MVSSKIVKLNARTPGQRGKEVIKYEGLYKGAPHRPLLEILKKSGGRNNRGVITTRHKGGGHKRFLRVIDFLRTKDGIPATIERIEKDPNRSALIALVVYNDGERRYIIAPANLKPGDVISSGETAPIKTGNCLPLKNIPAGTTIHCLELQPKKGAQLLRSAGSSGIIAGREGGYALIRLRSGELRRVLLACRAVVGEVGNNQHNLKSLGKAGAKRWVGVRPTVRGVAMNPVDHPHGGGEGKTSGGRHPVTPWGVPTKGYKTRKNKKSSRFIVRSRHKN
jgi:large subunit ribosomal protein L2